MVVLFLFALIAFAHFAADFREFDDNDSTNYTNHCEDVLNCFATILHLGLLSDGGLGDFLVFELNHATPGPGWGVRRRLSRTLFDLAFFIVVTESLVCLCR